MTSEHKIQNDIRMSLSRHQCTVFRVNVGSVKTPDGRFFSAGVPSGHPDLYGFRWSDQQVFYIEVKNERGRPREDQIRFHNFLQSRHVIHGIARSPEDAVKIVKEGLVGYGFKD
ncbi:VRR-NUC domain-containing protein [Limosilactobacillus fermentum]|uniref:VRR-NUC domain-containing protein n=1 Tax=Limosilactobacillus fermentum TaxID=1613 RepID=UPI001786AD4C|nr:VRR-NUC domain-containing protein [Limosilactobacillus fermentum]MBD5808963.1 VRR-NUC domain-containing protein [Limosilactobacillus fermentum]